MTMNATTATAAIPSARRFAERPRVRVALGLARRVAWPAHRSGAASGALGGQGSLIPAASRRPGRPSGGSGGGPRSGRPTPRRWSRPGSRDPRSPRTARDLRGRREDPAEERRRGPAVRSAAEATWALGMRRMCVGARGAMSRIARTASSSWTFVDGISPATIRQKRQSATRSWLIGLPQLRLRAHEEPDRPDEPGHDVRHVALPARPRGPDQVVHAGADPEQGSQVRALDEERQDEVERVDRQRDEEPRPLEEGRLRGRRRARSRSGTAPGR